MLFNYYSSILCKSTEIGWEYVLFIYGYKLSNVKIWWVLIVLYVRMTEPHGRKYDILIIKNYNLIEANKLKII